MFSLLTNQNVDALTNEHVSNYLPFIRESSYMY